VGENFMLASPVACPPGSDHLAARLTVADDRYPIRIVPLNSDRTWSFSVSTADLATSPAGSDFADSIDCVDAFDRTLAVYNPLDLFLSDGLSSSLTFVSTAATTGRVTVTPAAACPYGETRAAVSLTFTSADDTQTWTAPEQSITVGANGSWPSTTFSVSAPFALGHLSSRVGCLTGTDWTAPSTFQYVVSQSGITP
jgi:hypothetical protein